MSYEPKLFIKRKDLLAIESELENEQYFENHPYVERVAKELLSVKDSFIDFEGVEIIYWQPEGTTFNAHVRERLDDGNVYYKTEA